MIMAKKRRSTGKAPQPKRKVKKRRRVLRWIINIVLLIVLLAGIALVFNDQIKNWFMQKNTDKYAIENVTREDIEKNMEAEANYDFDQVIPVSTEAVLRAQFQNSNLPVIGAIAIPKVSINLPIFKGVQYDALFYGAGTTSAEQVMGEGNYGLASHRAADMNLLFSPLEKVSEGDLIYLTDLAKVFTYKVYSITRVPPSAGYVLNDVPGKKVVTLVTCSDGAGTERLIVQGELTDTVSVDDASEIMANAFNAAKNTY